MNQNFIALWIATWKCPLNCPYCINTLSGITHAQSSGIPVSLDCDKWVSTWNRYSPKLLMISGGEPFLIPNMVDVIAGLRCTVAINTNLTQDVSEFIERIPPRPNLTFLASYHPTQKHDMFFDNANKIRQEGHSIAVAFITYPKQLHLHERVKNECKKRGLQLRIETCLDLNNLLPYTDEEERIAKTISPGCRHHFINEVPTDKTIVCSGGHNYICVDPSGDTFRCTSKAVCEQEKEVIGNILEDNNVVSSVPMQICTYGRCCPSDEDNIRREIQ